MVLRFVWCDLICSGFHHMVCLMNKQAGWVEVWEANLSPTPQAKWGFGLSSGHLLSLLEIGLCSSGAQ